MAHTAFSYPPYYSQRKHQVVELTDPISCAASKLLGSIGIRLIDPKSRLATWSILWLQHKYLLRLYNVVYRSSARLIWYCSLKALNISLDDLPVNHLPLGAYWDIGRMIIPKDIVIWITHAFMSVTQIVSNIVRGDQKNDGALFSWQRPWSISEYCF